MIGTAPKATKAGFNLGPILVILSRIPTIAAISVEDTKAKIQIFFSG